VCTCVITAVQKGLLYGNSTCVVMRPSAEDETGVFYCVIVFYRIRSGVRASAKFMSKSTSTSKAGKAMDAFAAYDGNVSAVDDLAVKGARFAGAEGFGTTGLNLVFKDVVDNKIVTHAVFLVDTAKPDGRIFNAEDMATFKDVFASVWLRKPIDRWRRFCGGLELPLANQTRFLYTILLPSGGSVAVCVAGDKEAIYLFASNSHANAAEGILTAAGYVVTSVVRALDPALEAAVITMFNPVKCGEFRMTDGVDGFCMFKGQLSESGARNTYVISSRSYFHKAERRILASASDPMVIHPPIGTFGFADVSLLRPGKVCKGPLATVFVCDTGNRRIRHIGASGAVCKDIYLPSSPVTVSHDPISGRLFVTTGTELLTFQHPWAGISSSHDLPFDTVTSSVAIPGTDACVLAGPSAIGRMTETGQFKAIDTELSATPQLAVGPCGRLVLCCGSDVTVFSAYDLIKLSTWELPGSFVAQHISLFDDKLFAVNETGLVIAVRM
jgi:hypothetical protein